MEEKRGQEGLIANVFFTGSNLLPTQVAILQLYRRVLRYAHYQEVHLKHSPVHSIVIFLIQCTTTIYTLHSLGSSQTQQGLKRSEKKSVAPPHFFLPHLYFGSLPADRDVLRFFLGSVFLNNIQILSADHIESLPPHTIPTAEEPHAPKALRHQKRPG